MRRPLPTVDRGFRGVVRRRYRCWCTLSQHVEDTASEVRWRRWMDMAIRACSWAWNIYGLRRVSLSVITVAITRVAANKLKIKTDAKCNLGSSHCYRAISALPASSDFNRSIRSGKWFPASSGPIIEWSTPLGIEVPVRPSSRNKTGWLSMIA